MNDSREAMFWELSPSGGGAVCALCPHVCVIPAGRTGLCGVRHNAGGIIIAGAYGLISSAALDPVEKKPLARYKPGASVLSVGGVGCSMRCPYCQNSGISLEYNIDGTRCLPPENLIELAHKYVPQGKIGVA
jgi:pyruvate formate lyase activating enzyme